VHLQEVGREYGTTTGRRRRCGWLDLVVMKHSCLINGYDTLNLTKLDILDDLEEIKVGVKYLVNEQELSGFPGASGWTIIVYGLLIIRFRSRLGCSRSSRSGLRCVAWMEDIDLFGQVL
jgi:adenylosuccinate synthase